jgi:hypothetical protein
MSSKVKTTLVLYEESLQEDFKHPSKYYIRIASGDLLYIHCRDRLVAVQYVKDNFDGKYGIRTAKQSKGSGEYSCTGVNSRKGFAANLRPTN